MADLGRKGRTMLEAYDDETLPSSSDLDRMWDRIGESVAAGEVVEGPPEPDVEPSRSRHVWVAAGVAAAAALVIGTLLGPQLLAELDGGNGHVEAAYGVDGIPTSEAAVSKNEPTAAARSGAERAPDELPPETEAPVEEPAGEAQPAERAKAKRRGPGGDEALESEVELLMKARTALRGEKPRRALSLLRKHERRFPETTMADERALLRVNALCESGQPRRARGAADAFLRERPRSAFAAKIRSVCRGAN